LSVSRCDSVSRFSISSMQLFWRYLADKLNLM
jgi:hypothetical protein